MASIAENLNKTYSRIKNYYSTKMDIVAHKTTIGNRLQQLMLAKNLNAVQLARLSGVKPTFIYDIVSGKSANPSIVKLAPIVDALEVDISSLVNGTSHLPPKARINDEDDAYVTISSVLVEASMGGGSVITFEEQGKPYYFRREWIRNRLGASPSDLRMIFVRGDSMEPSLQAGDMILIDITKKNPSPSGIFVLFDGMGLVAKRLEFISGNVPSIRIISDNPQYSPYILQADELHIIGRVVWFAREL